MNHNPPPNSSSLLGVITSAIKAVPAVRYALAVAGIGASVALIAGFTTDLRIAIFGIIILFIFMAVMVVFARLASVAAGSLYVLAMVLAWAAVLLIISTSVLLLTSVFFNRPRPLSRWIEGTVSSDKAGQSEKEPVILQQSKASPTPTSTIAPSPSEVPKSTPVKHSIPCTAERKLYGQC